jgi:hypothetical protein
MADYSFQPANLRNLSWFNKPGGMRRIFFWGDLNDTFEFGGSARSGIPGSIYCQKLSCRFPLHFILILIFAFMDLVLRPEWSLQLLICPQSHASGPAFRYIYMFDHSLSKPSNLRQEIITWTSFITFCKVLQRSQGLAYIVRPLFISSNRSCKKKIRPELSLRLHQ